MTNLAPILLFTTAAMITPGPNNLMLLNAGLHFGIKRSLSLYFGIVVGFSLMVFILALGLGEIFLQYPIIEKALKISGSCYMLYLAYKILTSHNKIKEGHKVKPLGFFNALLLQWVNPKAWIMAISAIALFSIKSHPLKNAIFLSSIFFMVCLPCLATWLCFGKFLQKLLKEPKHRNWFNALMAAALVGSIAMIFIE